MEGKGMERRRGSEKGREEEMRGLVGNRTEMEESGKEEKCGKEERKWKGRKKENGKDGEREERERIKSWWKESI